MPHEVHHGDSRQVLATLPDQSVDCVITDPPYPGIKRDYGTWTEAEWRDLMADVVAQVRRVLKPSGSAVFVLQPNFRKLGSMSLWLWDWMLDTARTWPGGGLIQNVYWHKPDTLPTAGCNRKVGLCRNSVKYCCWFGPADCYRNQDAVLVKAAPTTAAKLADDKLQRRVSGNYVKNSRAYGTAIERGGATPFNLLRFGNHHDNSGRWGHGAGTPLTLADWWVRYICPPGGTVLDPFAGVATIGVAAVRRGCSYLGVEAMAEYATKANERLQREGLHTA